MQIKQSDSKPIRGLMKLFSLFLFLFPAIAFSQTTYLPIGLEENILIERMEIKLGNDPNFIFSKTKPYSRKVIVPAIKDLFDRHIYAYGKTEVSPDTTSIDALTSRLSIIDGYNMRRALSNNI